MYIESVARVRLFCVLPLSRFRYQQVEVATFVRHPDTGEMLPAEASGRIRPGDELVDINGNNVEGMNGDDATALIRKVNT